MLLRLLGMQHHIHMPRWKLCPRSAAGMRGCLQIVLPASGALQHFADKRADL